MFVFQVVGSYSHVHSCCFFIVIHCDLFHHCSSVIQEQFEGPKVKCLEETCETAPTHVLDTSYMPIISYVDTVP
jgi:hypothetical protein